MTVSGDRPALSYVVNSLNPGGTERLVVEMSTAFSGEYDIQVVCLDEPGTWAADLRRRGIPVHVLWRQPGLDLSMPLKLARLFRDHKTQIIHAHQCTPWFYAALSRVRYSSPRLLFEEHGRFYPEVEARARFLVNRVLIRRLTDRFIAVSSDIRERLVRFEGLDHGQIEVIYNGVAPAPQLTAEERTQLRQEFGFRPDHFVVGTVGRFDSIKNFPMLVKSLESAGGHLPGLRGLLVGHGPEFSDINARVRRGPMCDRIQLPGFRTDARRLVQCLDLFVLSSFSEGTSMALLEAMAASVAVAVTDVGGNPEIVVRDETGWVIPSDDAEALTKVIVDAASHPDLRRKFASAGQTRFGTLFAMDQMLDQYRQRYRELLATTV